MDATLNADPTEGKDGMTEGFALNQPNVDEEDDLRRAGMVVGIVERAFALQPGALHASTAARMRSADLVGARNVAAFLLRRDCHLEFPMIADTVGWRDQSSARYAYDRAKVKFDNEPDGKFAQVVTRIADFVQMQMQTPALHVATPEAFEQPDVDEEDRLKMKMPDDAPRSVRGGFRSI